MKIKAEGKQYDLFFQYEGDVTRCILAMDGTEITRGAVARHKDDKNVKFTARKFALAKALKPVVDRSFRTVVWQEYLKQVKFPVK